MPRYFFHTEDGTSDLDQEGVELPDVRAAQIEAVRLMGEMLKDEAPRFWKQPAMKLIVTEKSGLILFVLHLSAVEAPAIRLLA